jgi:glycerophosphoryl diester phosphodiesterase
MVARASRSPRFIGEVVGAFTLVLEPCLAQWAVVPTRLPSLRRPPIGFAHRGARANAPENTLEAFQLAVRLGATGLESDVWLTADGQAVLDHDGVVRQGLRKRPISALRREELPAHIPTLGELYALVGTSHDLSLDVKDTDAFDEVVAVATAAGDDALGRLWLCHHRTSQVVAWRERCPGVRLVDSTFLGHMPDGPERRAAELAEAGIDAVNLHHSEWTGGLTSLFHRFEVLCFGWDAQHDRILDGLLDAGVDAVYSDHVDRMVDALARAL